jgi:NTE family protein
MKSHYIIGLQGGGSHGVFSAGVLSGLLQDRDIEIEALSGASAGAINAVLVADGLLTSSEKAIENLKYFWEKIATHPIMASMFAQMSKTGLTKSFSQLSPYQINPLGLNPLREIMGDMVNFERLQQSSPVKLFISTTRVSDGQARIFTEKDVNLDVIMASTCLPRIHHSVILDGEAYWDGGYTANPPLRVMVENTQAKKLLLVQLTESQQGLAPRSMEEINRYLTMMPFHSGLLREVSGLETLLLMADQKELNPENQLEQRLQGFEFTKILAENYFDISKTDPMNTSDIVLSRLYELGLMGFQEYRSEQTKENQNAY